MNTKPHDYTRLSLADVRRSLDAIAEEAAAAFGSVDSRPLNWRPTATRWSVAQCFDHLLSANRHMFQAAADTLSGAPPTIWQRLPLLPGLFGRMMIRSQTPDSGRKFKAPSKSQPAASDIPADVISRFLAQLRDGAAAVDRLDEGQAARAIMTSPFAGFITYSVLDGWRLIVAHDRRHVEQARRVTLAPGFPVRSADPAATVQGLPQRRS